VSELETVRTLARGALDSLELSRERIDDLNVYPVPDGDTGTNLTLTVRGLVEALDASTTVDRQTLAHEAARAALMSARGNSGVILSQIVRGAADELGTAGTVDGRAIAHAFRGASATHGRCSSSWSPPLPRQVVGLHRRLDGLLYWPRWSPVSTATWLRWRGRAVRGVSLDP